MGPKVKCKKLVKYGASFPKPLEAVHLPGVAVVKMQPGLPGLPAWPVPWPALRWPVVWDGSSHRSGRGDKTR